MSQKSVTINNVLFDLDGTFADTAPDLAYALNTLLQEEGKPELSLPAVAPYVSLGGIAMVSMAFEMSSEDPQFEDLKERFLQIYRENIARHTRLYEGIQQVLDDIHQRRMPWGIVTNKATWLTRPLIEALEIQPATDCVVCGDTLKVNKPHPAPLLHACELLNCEPGETVYIGDARRDVEAGSSAGMQTLVAAWGYIDANEDTELWGASGIVQSPLDLLTWLHSRAA